MRKKLFLGIIMVSTTMLLFACKANHSEEEDKTASKQTDHNEKNETKKDIKKDVINVEELCIQNGENTIYGKLYVPVEEGKHPVIILSHGYNGTNNDFVNECKYYAQNGYLAYAFDFCGGSGGSKSTGKTTDMTIFTEKEDLHSVFQYVKGLNSIQSENIFLFGGSQGGLVSALTTEELLDEVRGLILLFPAMCIADDWNKHFQSECDIPEVHEFWGMQLGKNFFMSLRGFDVFQNIGVYQRNVQIVYGSDDPVVPLSYMEKLTTIYPHAKLDIFPHEGHGFTDEGNQKLAEITLAFIHQNKISAK